MQLGEMQHFNNMATWRNAIQGNATLPDIMSKEGVMKKKNKK